MRVLHVGAEVFPLVKTGGLADVLGALPSALVAQGAQVRLLLPGLPPIMDALAGAHVLCDLSQAFGAARVRVLRAQMPLLGLPVYVVDAPFLYRRRGGPYQAEDGTEWGDNLQRFGLLGWVAAQLACGGVDADWAPQVVHAHDWHAALACAYLEPLHAARSVATVFTIHNLAFQGLFPLQDGALLGLPARFMQPAALEYHGQLSFMKAGLKFADAITTVSPSYAQEMTTAEFGAGLDGVIRKRAADVTGILNGIDTAVWNPASDRALAQTYSAEHLAGKVACKAALQREAGLQADPRQPLLAMVSRLTTQKGVDLLLAAMGRFLQQGVQLVVQGSGDAELVAALHALAAAHPGQVGLFVGYDEARAHRVIAGADMILVPSRFEPCGLTQLYGLRYGTLPVVRRVGGLADTVVDASDAARRAHRATGFVFDEATPVALALALERALACWHDAAGWRALMQTAMTRDFSWAGPAREYLGLYQQLVLGLAPGVASGATSGVTAG